MIQTYLSQSASGLQPHMPLRFVDFGCGTGGSFAFAESVEPAGKAGGIGIGIDLAADSVDTCNAKGIYAEVGDIVDFDARNIAAASFAVDVLPELPGRAACEKALVNVVRAARNYSLIQHAYFDVDGEMATRGLMLPGNDSKRIQYKPTLADYLNFTRRHFEALNITGLAVFGLGTASAAAVELPGLPVAAGSPEETRPYRSLRVVFGRREVNRFRAALEKAAAGKVLFIWERL